jgi:hypothetical protein
MVRTYRVTVHRHRVAAAIFMCLIASVAATVPACATPAKAKATVDLRVRGEASESSGGGAGPLVPFAGTLRCGLRLNHATGDFAGRATPLCAQARRKTALLRRLDRPNTRLCSQIYSGPEHARITGTVDGAHVDIAIARSDGCGTADWQQLQWLLGPPVR